MPGDHCNEPMIQKGIIGGPIFSVKKGPDFGPTSRQIHKSGWVYCGFRVLMGLTSAQLPDFNFVFGEEENPS
ncbi:hypothetical protein [Nitrosomonas sp. wSCUT-2]